jgi:glyoxalase family protein
MTILGLHHITLICSNAQRTVDFYTGVLGLRLVKKTVNFDDPGSYHLYFGDEIGRPGTAITFFEWSGAAQGYPGIGGTHHFALQVADYAGLLQWKRRLIDLGLSIEGPLDRNYFKSIYFRDPDGTILEIATQGPGWSVDEDSDQLGARYCPPPSQMVIDNRDEAHIAAETWSEPVPSITPGMALSFGMHHITAIGAGIQRTHAFFGELLGLRLVKRTSNFDDPVSAHWYWSADEGRPGLSGSFRATITYFERDPNRERRASFGAGQTHHFALAVADEDSQLEWREKLVWAGLPVSPVMDRVYFKSIYTRDPDGHIVELATLGPGFTIDEDPKDLGRRLRLPPWLEARRPAIERALGPVTAPEWILPR